MTSRHQPQRREPLYLKKRSQSSYRNSDLDLFPLFLKICSRPIIERHAFASQNSDDSAQLFFFFFFFKLLFDNYAVSDYLVSISATAKSSYLVSLMVHFKIKRGAKIALHIQRKMLALKILKLTSFLRNARVSSVYLKVLQWNK